MSPLDATTGQIPVAIKEGEMAITAFVAMSSVRLQDLFFAHTGHVSDKWEQYLGIYESELTPIINRGAPVSLLEIGVQNGGSLQIWEKYLTPGSEVFGIDVDPKCARLDLGPNIAVAIADATREEQVGTALGRRTFDVIIDDGSHLCSDVIHAFHLLFERLRPGGKYFIEDLHCSYWRSHGGGLKEPNASIEWLKGLVDSLNADHFGVESSGTVSAWTRTISAEVARITFYDSLAVVEKLGTPKYTPYRRLLTGETGTVADLAQWFATGSTAEVATILTGPTTARHIERSLLDEIALLRDERERERSELASLDEALAEARVALDSRDDHIARLNQAVAERDDHIARLAQAVAERDGQIASLAQAVAEHDRRMVTLNQSVANRDRRIVQLNQAVTKRDLMLHAMRSSTSWRVTAPLRVVKTAASRLYPRRRMTNGPSVTAKSLFYDMQDAKSDQPIAALTRTESVAHLPANALTTTEAEVHSSTPQVSPVPTCRGDNGEVRALMNHALWRYLLREFGFGDAAQTMSLLADFSLLTPSSDSVPPPAAAEFSRWVLGLRRLLSKSVCEQPEVTVILPVHNQLRHTLACLTSLLTWPTDRTFEVIVADDASTDATAKLLGDLPAPVRLIRQEQNLGFLRNCNRVATKARGNVLVFLNNDTFVLPGWLDELIRTFDDHDRAGLVGSKLLFPDGRLQEAGGLIWSDGSGWNFGRGQDPDEPHLNFCREMDYCSAASIAVRTWLWRQLGGFDERYAPAYYEDSDLAFRIREAGLRVLYQPRSQLIHFEGISHGVKTTSGVKQYQVTNQQEFLRRWTSVLTDRRVPEQTVGYYCRHHLGAHALFVDACTPTPDHDSGSIDALNLMRMLKQFGLHVTFFPNSNPAHCGRYTRDLQRRGIECLYRPFVARLEPWLEKHGRELRVVVLSRVSQASAVLPLVRDLAPQTAIVFNTVDIHFLRLAREAELASDSIKLQESERIRRAELEVIAKVDLTLVVSKHEKEMLRSLVPEAKIGWLPLPREIPGRCENPSSNRRDIVFLGGFDHLPNRDAVEYFLKEIWPLILSEEPRVHFVIAGSKMPKEYWEFSQQGVEVRGFVEYLEPFFAEARVSVAPLRYGAGQKGKVVTSFSYGVPVVCTPVAAEGMEISNGEHALVAESARDFAASVLRVVRDDSLWERLSLNGLALAERLHSYERVAERFHTMLRDIGVPVAETRNARDSRVALE